MTTPSHIAELGRRRQEHLAQLEQEATHPSLEQFLRLQHAAGASILEALELVNREPFYDGIPEVDKQEAAHRIYSQT